MIVKMFVGVGVIVVQLFIFDMIITLHVLV